MNDKTNTNVYNESFNFLKLIKCKIKRAWIIKMDFFCTLRDRFQTLRSFFNRKRDPMEWFIRYRHSGTNHFYILLSISHSFLYFYVLIIYL